MGVKTAGHKPGPPSLSVNIGRIKLKNPVMVASGTFGYGEEFKDLVCLRDIGAIITKSVTVEPYQGNPPPRIWETTAGMLNAIGLQNEGIDDFIKNKLPFLDSIRSYRAIKEPRQNQALQRRFLKKIGTAIIVSIAGETKQEYQELAKRLDRTDIDGIEINISCPNIGSHNLGNRQRATSDERRATKLFAQDAEATADIVRAVRRETRKTIITKLSPNVTDITEIARAAERAGSDAVSLINTIIGMGVDIETRRPRLGNITGGLSGPAIKPLALRMVWEVYRVVRLPIIGIGGIMNAEDAVEFFLCGATAAQIGTANFVNPDAATQIIEGLKDYLKKNRLKSIKDLTGKLQV